MVHVCVVCGMYVVCLCMCLLIVGVFQHFKMQSKANIHTQLGLSDITLIIRFLVLAATHLIRVISNWSDLFLFFFTTGTPQVCKKGSIGVRNRAWDLGITDGTS